MAVTAADLGTFPGTICSTWRVSLRASTAVTMRSQYAPSDSYKAALGMINFLCQRSAQRAARTKMANALRSPREAKRPGGLIDTQFLHGAQNEDTAIIRHSFRPDPLWAGYPERAHPAPIQVPTSTAQRAAGFSSPTRNNAATMSDCVTMPTSL